MGIISACSRIKADILNRVDIKRYNVTVGAGTVIRGRLLLWPGGKTVIGRNCIINSTPGINIIGGDTRSALRTEGDGRIIIGDNVGISNSTFVACYDTIQVDDNVKIGGSCCLYDNDFHSERFNERLEEMDRKTEVKHGSIHIKEGAFIGAKCIVLKGVTIGRHSIIGAGSVVTKSVPDCEVWAGNPARFIRKLEDK